MRSAKGQITLMERLELLAVISLYELDYTATQVKYDISNRIWMKYIRLRYLYFKGEIFLLFNLIRFDFYIHLTGLFTVISYLKRIFSYPNKTVESTDSERSKSFSDFVNETFAASPIKIAGISQTIGDISEFFLKTRFIWYSSSLI